MRRFYSLILIVLFFLNAAFVAAVDDAAEISPADKLGETSGNETLAQPDIPAEEADENPDSIADSEIETSDASSESEETPPAVPEKSFINPWSGSEEKIVADFLAQNWFIATQLQKRRDLGLAIAMAGKSNRDFRRESELLLRDPGMSSYFSALSLFPKLLQTSLHVFSNLVKNFAEQLAARQISSVEVLVAVDRELLRAEAELNVCLTHLQAFSDSLERFLVLTRRKTRISLLHNLIRSQNLNLHERLHRQQQKFAQILSQHRHRLDEARVQLKFLQNLKTESPVVIATRLQRIFQLLEESLQSIDDYYSQLMFFAVKFKTALTQNLAETEKLAGAVEKNRFHIVDSLQKFPERDFNLQKSEVYSYQDWLHTVVTSLNAQNAELPGETVPAENDLDAYVKVLLMLDKDFLQFESFKELFDFCYYPKPEVPEEKSGPAEKNSEANPVADASED